MSTKIDIDANADIKDIRAEEGGEVHNEVRVTIAAGVSKSEAHRALQSISSVLIGDQIKLAD